MLAVGGGRTRNGSMRELALGSKLDNLLKCVERSMKGKRKTTRLLEA